MTRTMFEQGFVPTIAQKTLGPHNCELLGYSKWG